MIVLEVAVAAPVFNTYSYELSRDRQEFFETSPLKLIGCRVFVPFGSRKITGYIIGIEKKAGEQIGLKEIYDLLDEEPLFHQEMVALFKWVADYYHYPLGKVIQTALPGGLTVQAQKIIRMNREAELSEFTDTNAFGSGWFRRLAQTGSLSARESKKIFSSPVEMKKLTPLLESGLVSIAAIQSRGLATKKTETCYFLKDLGQKLCRQIDQDAEKKELELSADTMLLTKGEQKTLRCAWKIFQTIQNRQIPRKELLARYPYSAQVIPALIKKNLLEKSKKRIFRTPFGDLLPYIEAPENLTEEQCSAVKRIVGSIDKNRYEAILLHGITGSRKNRGLPQGC